VHQRRFLSRKTALHNGSTSQQQGICSKAWQFQLPGFTIADGFVSGSSTQMTAAMLR